MFIGGNMSNHPQSCIPASRWSKLEAATLFTYFYQVGGSLIPIVVNRDGDGFYYSFKICYFETSTFGASTKTEHLFAKS